MGVPREKCYITCTDCSTGTGRHYHTGSDRIIPLAENQKAPEDDGPLNFYDRMDRVERDQKMAQQRAWHEASRRILSQPAEWAQ